MMTLHPRHNQVTRANIEIAEAVCSAAQKHELTYAELMSILAGLMTSWTKSEIKQERSEDRS